MARSNKTAPSGAAPTQQQVFVVVNPITYGDPEVRRETGEEVSDLPASSVPWLLEQGHIRRKEGN